MKAGAGQRQQHAHAQTDREGRGSAIRNERQRHALGRHQPERREQIHHGLKAEARDEAGAAKHDEHVLLPRQAQQAAQHDEAEHADQQQTDDQAIFLAHDGEDDVGMDVGDGFLDDALAGSAAEPAAAGEGVHDLADLVVGLLVPEHVEAAADVAQHGVQRDGGAAGTAQKHGEPHQMDAADEQLGQEHGQDDRDHADIRLLLQDQQDRRQQAKRDPYAGKPRRPALPRDQPRGCDREKGFQKLAWLQPEARDRQPARRPLGADADHQRQEGRRQRHRASRNRQTAHPARRQHRHADDDRHRDRQKKQLFDHERLAGDAHEVVGHRRAGRQHHHVAAANQQADRAQSQAIDGEPPAGEARVVDAGHRVHDAFQIGAFMPRSRFARS